MCKYVGTWERAILRPAALASDFVKLSDGCGALSLMGVTQKLTSQYEWGRPRSKMISGSIEALEESLDVSSLFCWVCVEINKGFAV